MANKVSTYVKGFHNEKAVEDMIYNDLGNTGLKISKLAFGASGLAGCYQHATEEDLINVVVTAVQNGINYIDTAPWYGNGLSESILGKALKRIPRQAFYIATKVGRYEPDVKKMFDFSREKTLNSINDSLSRLGLDYVDILQVHDMEFAPSLDVIITETLPAIEEIRKNGKTKFIGITGYPLENFRTVLNKSTVHIDTILSYCRGCMHDTAILDYVPYFKSKGIGIINASPIGMGLYNERGPPDWHPVTMEIKDKCLQAVQYCKERDVNISKLAMKHSFNLPDIVTTLASSESLDLLYSNLNVLKTDLTEKEKEVYDDIMIKFMKPIRIKNWEGVEVDDFLTKH